MNINIGRAIRASRGSFRFFRHELSEVGKEERLKFIVMKTEDGKITEKTSFYCRALEVTIVAFYDYLDHKGEPWKYQPLAEEMMRIHSEDKCDDCNVNQIRK